MGKSKRKPSSLFRVVMLTLSLSFFSMITYGSYLALDALNMVPDYRTPKDRARKALEDERAAVMEAKKQAPELYTEPVEFYLKDAIDAYEKAEDK